MARGFDLSAYGLHAPDVIYDASLGLLYEDGVVCDGDWITATGALATNSGDRTRRSPRDRRIVESPAIDSHVDWNEFTQKLSEKSFAALHKAAIDYLNTCGRLYVVDGYYGADPEHRLKVRVICARAYHALFMRTMLVRPTTEERAGFAAPDALILNAGQSPADPKTPGLSSAVSVSIRLATGEVVILGTDYAAEMKGALFTLAGYRHVEQGVLALRASAMEDPRSGVTLLVGLPATGKTTLAIGAAQQFVADDAVAWSDRGVTNLEGGCYPRCHGIASAEQPELAAAIRFGALLENVVVDPRTRLPDYRDTTLTENTRAAFPLEHIVEANRSAFHGHPTNVILLVCDATGVLPPVSRLTAEQAAYYYLSGYSSKLPTAAGASAEALFSPCYGAGLLVHAPERFVELFSERLRARAPRTWLVNTGWSGEPASTNRISLTHSRTIISAIVSGAIEGQPTVAEPIFGLEIPARVEAVPAELLHPWESWRSAEAYRAAALRLAEQFQANFQQHANWSSADLAAAGPRVSEVAAT